MGRDIHEDSEGLSISGITARVRDTIAKRDKKDQEDILIEKKIIFETPDNTYGFMQLYDNHEIVGIAFPNDANVYLDQENVLVGDPNQIVKRYLAEEGSIEGELIPFIDVDHLLEIPGDPNDIETLLLLKDSLNNQILAITEDGEVSEYAGDVRPEYTEEIPEPDDE